MAVGYEMSLQDYLRVILKRKWIILVCTFAVFVTSIVYTSKLPPRYATSGKLELQYQSTLSSLLADALLYKGNEFATAVQFATSLPVLERAVVILGKVSPNATTAEKARAVAEIGGVTATGDGQTNFITISYTSGDPVYCAKVVNAVMQGFVEAYEVRNTRDATRIEKFLEEQMLAAEEDLLNAELELLAHRSRPDYVELTPGYRIPVEKASELSGDLERVRSERAQVERELAEAQRQSSEEASPELSEFIATHPRLGEIRARLTEAEMLLSSKLRDLTPRHPEVREGEERVRRLRTELELTITDVIRNREKELEDRLASLRARESSLERIRPQVGVALDRLPQDQLEQSRLQREIESRQKLFGFFRDKLEEKRYDQMIQQENTVQIVEPATVPGAPYYPNKTTNSIIGAAIGLMLGFALAFVVEAMDTSIGTIEDVERTTGVSVLGVIPSIAVEEEQPAEKAVVTFDPDRVRTRDIKDRLMELEGAAKKGIPGGGLYRPQLITYYDPKSPISEAYRTLRTNVQFKGFLGTAKTLTVTSSGPQEGKTTTLCNLAVTMAQSGQKVLAVGCNLRRPALHKMFGINKKPGVTDVLIGARDWRDVVQKTGIDNLDAFCSGPIPPNPSELLGSPEMSELIRQVREEYDLVIFDCPPVLPVTDAAVLSSKIDAVLLVYYVNRAAREALLRAKTQLENVGAKILGVVLNHIPAEGRLGYSYYYYHYHYYGESSRDERQEKLLKRTVT